MKSKLIILLVCIMLATSSYAIFDRKLFTSNIIIQTQANATANATTTNGTSNHSLLTNLDWSEANHTLDSNLIPNVNSNYNLGDTSKAWANMYLAYTLYDTSNLSVISSSSRHLYDYSGNTIINFNANANPVYISGDVDIQGNDLSATGLYDSGNNFRIDLDSGILKSTGGTDNILNFHTSGRADFLDNEILTTGLVGLNSPTFLSRPLNIRADSRNCTIKHEEYQGSELWCEGVSKEGDMVYFNSGETTPSVTFRDDGQVRWEGDLVLTQGYGAAIGFDTDQKTRIANLQIIDQDKGTIVIQTEKDTAGTQGSISIGITSGTATPNGARTCTWNVERTTGNPFDMWFNCSDGSKSKTVLSFDHSENEWDFYSNNISLTSPDGTVGNCGMNNDKTFICS